MSLRDVLDRITGRRASNGREVGRTRSRSQATVQLAVDQRPGFQGSSPAAPSGGPAAAPPNPSEAPPVEAHSESAPAPEPRPRTEPYVSPAANDVPAGTTAPGTTGSPNAPADEETQIHRPPIYKKEDVVGVLVAIDGELKGELFKLFDGENKLGRSEASDVVLSSKWISREHAMLVHQDGVFALLPRTESNRTYVNEQEVDGSEISDGDAIRMGKTTFRFRIIEGL